MKIEIQFDLPEDCDGTTEVECDCCNDYFEAFEALPISNPLKRLAAGDTIPVGECPNCEHGFLYLMEDTDD